MCHTWGLARLLANLQGGHHGDVLHVGQQGGVVDAKISVMHQALKFISDSSSRLKLWHNTNSRFGAGILIGWGLSALRDIELRHTRQKSFVYTVSAPGEFYCHGQKYFWSRTGHNLVNKCTVPTTNDQAEAVGCEPVISRQCAWRPVHSGHKWDRVVRSKGCWFCSDEMLYIETKLGCERDALCETLHCVADAQC